MQIISGRKVGFLGFRKLCIRPSPKMKTNIGTHHFSINVIIKGNFVMTLTKCHSNFHVNFSEFFLLLRIHNGFTLPMALRLTLSILCMFGLFSYKKISHFRLIPSGGSF